MKRIAADQNDGLIAGRQFAGERLHRLDAPGRKDNVIAVFGGFTRQIGADSAGSSGYQGNRTSHIEGPLFSHSTAIEKV